VLLSPRTSLLGSIVARDLRATSNIDSRRTPLNSHRIPLIKRISRGRVSHGRVSCRCASRGRASHRHGPSRREPKKVGSGHVLYAVQRHGKFRQIKAASGRRSALDWIWFRWPFHPDCEYGEHAEVPRSSRSTTNEFPMELENPKEVEVN
jgi:hypothetical protein